MIQSRIDPYYLLYLLSHKYTQAQISQKVFIETTLSNISERWQELELPWSNSPEVRRDVSSRVRAAIQAKWEAQTGLDQLRTEFGHITT